MRPKFSKIYEQTVSIENVLVLFKIMEFWSVPSIRGRGGRTPLSAVCALPPFWITQDTIFGTYSSNDKRTDNGEKRNNIIQRQYSRSKFSRFLAKLLATNCST